MPMRRLLVLTLLLVLALAPAADASYQAVIRDCAQHSALGHLVGHYSRGDLQRALTHLPADVDEYTDCRSIISNALATKGAGRGFRGFTPPAGGSGGSPSDPLASATPDERRAVAQAQAGGGSPIRVGDAMIRPGELRTAASISDVPTPLLVAAILLLAVTLAVAAPRIVHRVLARRSS